MTDTREMIASFLACDIFFNPELNAVETRWKGPDAEGIKLYEILNAIIEAMKQKETGTVIADARNMHPINKVDSDWIISDWHPRALAAGFRFEALVVTDYTFNAVTVRKIVRTYDENKIRTAYFKTVPSAYDWVRKGCPI